jgi:MtN3 and saliva related transmembrane protein
MESSFALAAATWAIAMALSPALQIRRIVELKSARGVSIAYFLVLFVGFVLWLAYGIAADNFALIIPNALAVVVTGTTIAIALRYRELRESALGARPGGGAD